MAYIVGFTVFAAILFGGCIIISKKMVEKRNSIARIFLVKQNLPEKTATILLSVYLELLSLPILTFTIYVLWAFIASKI